MTDWLPYPTLLTDCGAIYANGTTTTDYYEVWPQGAPRSCNVLCDFTDPQRPLTVIQQRVDASVNFQRAWVEYKRGFGVLYLIFYGIRYV